MNESITLRRFIGYYLRYCKTYNTAMTVMNKKTYLRRYLKYFRRRQLADIKRIDIERYVQARRSTASNAILNRELSTLKHLFNYALVLGMVEVNPVKGIRFLREHRPPLNLPAAADIMVLLQWCLAPNPKTNDANDRLLYDLIVIAAMTGLRRGDVLKIRGENIDLGRRQLGVPVSKTGEVQYLPLNDTALRVLARRKRAGFIFANGDTHFKDFRRHFTRAKKAVGFTFRYRDLRPYAITEMLVKGADIRTVQDMAGHRHLATTERYLIIAKPRCRAAVQLLDFGPPAPSSNLFLPFLYERATGLEPATLSLEDGGTAEEVRP